MAMAPTGALEPSTARDRFFKLTTLLISGGTKIIRGYFDSIHHPSNLASVLKNQRAKLKTIFTSVEWRKLYPSNSSYGRSEDFDLTILIKLLRNICNLTAPSRGWDKLPDTTELSLEADIARIKYYRNKIYAHPSKLELSDIEFTDLWNEIKAALLRIVRKYNPSNVDEWETQIDRSLTGPITEDDIDIYHSGFPGML